MVRWSCCCARVWNHACTQSLFWNTWGLSNHIPLGFHVVDHVAVREKCNRESKYYSRIWDTIYSSNQYMENGYQCMSLQLQPCDFLNYKYYPCSPALLCQVCMAFGVVKLASQSLGKAVGMKRLQVQPAYLELHDHACRDSRLEFAHISYVNSSYGRSFFSPNRNSYSYDSNCCNGPWWAGYLFPTNGCFGCP